MGGIAMLATCTTWPWGWHCLLLWDASVRCHCASATQCRWWMPQRLLGIQFEAVVMPGLLRDPQ